MRDARLHAVSPSDSQAGLPRIGMGRMAWCRGLACVVVAGIIMADACASARAEQPPAFSGFYIGLNAGAAWGRTDFSTNPNCPPTIVDAPFCNAAPDPAAANGTAV